MTPVDKTKTASSCSCTWTTGLNVWLRQSAPASLLPLSTFKCLLASSRSGSTKSWEINIAGSHNYLLSFRVSPKAPLVMLKLLKPIWSNLSDFFCWYFSTSGNFLPPKNHKGPPLGWKIRKIVGMLSYIAQKWVFDTLNTTQNIQALYKVPFLKKSRKNCSKCSFLTILTIFNHFQPVFLDFFRNGTLHIAGFFVVVVLYSVHQNPFFWGI